MSATAIDFQLPEISIVKREELAKALICRPVFSRRITQIDGNVDFFELAMLYQHLSQRMALTPEQSIQLRIIRYILENQSSLAEPNSGIIRFESLLSMSNVNSPSAPNIAASQSAAPGVQKSVRATAPSGIKQSNQAEANAPKPAQNKAMPVIAKMPATAAPNPPATVRAQNAKPAAMQANAKSSSVPNGAAMDAKPRQIMVKPRGNNTPAVNNTNSKNSTNKTTSVGKQADRAAQPASGKSNIARPAQKSPVQGPVRNNVPAAPNTTSTPSDGKESTALFSGLLSTIRAHAAALPMNQNRVELTVSSNSIESATVVHPTPEIFVPSHSLVGPPPTSTMRS